MNMMVSELYDALLSAGADEAKARRAAEGLATSDQDFKKQFSELREDNQKMRTEMAALTGTLGNDMNGLKAGLQGEMASLKAGLQQEMGSLKSELRHEIQGLRGEMSLLKWMMGAVVALAVAILVRVLFV